MKRWKKRTATALCACMLVNLTSPAYGQSLILPGGGSTQTTATGSDTGDSWLTDEEELENDLATGSDWDEELENDLATNSDAELEVELEGVPATNSNLLLGEVPLEELEITNKPDYSGKTIYMEPGETYQLEVKVTPEDATDPYYFESNNPDVAAVDESGLIQAAGTGSTWIYVKAKTNYYVRSDFVSVQVVPDVVTVKLHANGGLFKNGREEKIIRANSEYGVSLEKPVKEGKIFDGNWYSDPGCTNVVLEDSSSYRGVEDIELYAGWSDYYEVVFDYNGVKVGGKTSETVLTPQGKKLPNYPYFSNDPEEYGNKLLKGWEKEDGTLLTSSDLYGYIPTKDETLKAVWSNYYTVFFDYNGGTDWNDKKGKNYYIIPGEELSSVPSSLTPPSYDVMFKGWQKENGDIVSENDLYSYVPSGNETIKAIWAKYYTISYNYNGGSGNPMDQSTVPEGEEFSSYPDTRREGFILSGWMVEETGQRLSPGEPFTPSSNVTLIAQWSQTWTITYDANGGAWKNSNNSVVQVERGASVYLIGGNSSVYRDGYELLGWCLDRDCKGEVLTRYYSPNADVTLYAKWASQAVITLNAGEGSFSDGSHVMKEFRAKGEKLGSKSLSQPTREGYVFGGWYEDAAFTRRVKSSYRVMGETTFYAKWEKTALCAVTLHVGGPWYYDSDKHEYVSETVIYVPQGEEIGYVRTPNRDGYESEWYLDSEYITPVNSMYIVEHDEDLYAKYAKTIKVSWDGNGGVNSNGQLRGSRTTGQGMACELTDRMFKEGMVFAGWFTSDGIQYTREKPVYENLSVTARWIEGCQVTLDLNGGQLSSYDTENYGSSFVVEKGKEIGRTLRPVKEGMVFAGWESEGKRYTSLYSVVVNTDMTFRAVWEKEAYRVTLHAEEGSIYDSYGTEKYKYVEEMTISVPGGKGGAYGLVPSAHYEKNNSGSGQRECAGWSLTRGGEILDLKTYEFTRDTDLYAIWKDAYTVICVLNGGAYNYTGSSTQSVQVIMGEPLTWPEDGRVTRNGYTFGGWYQNSDLTGTAIHVPSSNYIPSGNEILYAKWIPGELETYTVTFDTQGGSAVEPQTVALGELLVEPEAPAKPGSLFAGWYKDAQCIKKYDFTTPVYKNMTLYAKWSEAVDLKDASVTVEDTYVYTGEMIVPRLTVKMGNAMLQEVKDYTVSGGGIDAGTAEVTITAVADSAYKGSKTISFTIEKAEMNHPVPANLTAVYGQKLSEIDLSGWAGWQWVNGEKQAGAAGKQQHEMIYPASDSNHRDQKVTVEVTVSPRSIENGIIQLGGSRFQYTGIPIEPKVRIYLDGAVVSAIGYTVSYTNNTNPGTATVTVAGKGNYSGTITTTFTIKKGDPSLEIANQVYETEYGSLLKDIANLPRGWSWQQPDTKIDRATAPGNTTYMADFETYEGSNYESKNGISLKVKVNPRAILKADSSFVETRDFWIYTGEAIEPEVAVKDTLFGGAENVTLKKDIDYTVTYKDNREVGYAAAVITGKGNYTGSKEHRFQIIKDPYNIAEAEITLSPDNATYTGQEIKPDTSVLLAGKILERDKDYTVTYKNNVEPGYGMVTVTGTGTKGTDTYYGEQTVGFFIDPLNYELKAKYADLLNEVKLPSGWKWQKPDDFVGDVTEDDRIFLADFSMDALNRENVEFRIMVEPKNIMDPTIKITVESGVYNGGNSVEPKVTVTDEKLDQVLEENKDYTLRYSDNTNAGTGSVTVTGIHNYKGDVTRSFGIDQAESKPEIGSDRLDKNTKKMKLTIEDEPFFLYAVYAGDGTITFESGNPDIFTVEKKQGELGQDDGWVTVKGIGSASLTITVSDTQNYKGDVLTYEVIVSPVQLEENAITLAQASYVYTGKAIEPEFTVTTGGKELKKGTDYTVAYSENTDAGEGSVTITGINHYTGTATAGFTIEKAEWEAADPNPVSAVYGQKLNEIKLPETGHETWSWKDAEALVGDVGEHQYEAVLAGDKNHKDKTAQVTVRVTAKALTPSMIALEYESAEYTGSALEPKVTAEDEGLITENDYTVSYADNMQVGTATVTVTGQNNYAGVVSKTFEIVRAEIHREDVSVTGSWVYDGTQHTPEPKVTAGGRILEKDTDYTTAYGENIHAGAEAGVVIVTGIGSYTGVVSVYFDIEQAENPVEIPSVELNAVYGQKLSEIALPDGWAWRNPDAVIDKTGENRLEAYLKATEDYKEKTAVLVVTVEPKMLEASMVSVHAENLVYDGNEQKPEVTVMDGETAVAAENYTVAYENNLHAGRGVVLVTGQKNYQGTIRSFFRIQKADPVLVIGAGNVINKKLREGSFSLEAELSNGETLTYVSSDPGVAEVDSQGLVTLKAVGKTVITISYEGSEDYNAVSGQVEVNVGRNSSGGSGSGSSGGSGSRPVSGSMGSSVPAGYTGAVKVLHQITVPVYVEEGNWSQNSDGSWKLAIGGVDVAGRWAPVYNPYADTRKGQSAFEWFLFDSMGIMKTGWYRDERGDTYYLNPESDNTKGRMVTGWVLINGVYYYFNEKPDGTRGALLRNTITPDGYRVDENGARQEKVR